MKKKPFITIGHITNDLEPTSHLGGSAAYIAVAAKKLGHPSLVITKAPKNHPYLKQLKDLGIMVHLLPSKSDHLTSFKNFYDPSGKRTQIVTQKQELIKEMDFKYFPQNLLKDSIIVVSPVINEVSPKLLRVLSHFGFLAVTAQGYFRETDQLGRVHFKPLEDCTFFKTAQAVFFSEEDITFKGVKNTFLLDSIKQNCPLTIMTQGEKGATVFKNKEVIYGKGYPLKSSETIDFTGAGDSFAAAFLSKFQSISDIKKVTTFSNLFAALKIRGRSGVGINSIPSTEQIKSYVIENKDRVLEYFKKEGVNLDSIL